jgi:hypothetical protein
LAGFEVSITGRFWVSTEVLAKPARLRLVGVSLVLRNSLLRRHGSKMGLLRRSALLLSEAG